MEKIREQSDLLTRIFYPIMGIIKGEWYGASTNNDKAIKYAEKKEKNIENSSDLYKAMVTFKRIVIPTINKILIIKNVLSSITSFIALPKINPLGGPSAASGNGTNKLSYKEKEKQVFHYGYRDEKMSDIFATMYGFGDDLASGLQKMTLQRGFKSGKIVNFTTSIVGPLIDLLNVPLLLVLGMTDEHPEMLTRAKTQLDYIDNELKNNKTLDPLMRRELQDQFNEIKDKIDDFVNISNHKDSTIIIRLYNKFMYEKFGGGFQEFKDENLKLLKYADSQIKDLKSV